MLLGTLLKNGLFLLKNVLKPLAENVLKLLGLTAVVSATDALEESGLVIKGVSKTIKMKKKIKGQISQYITRDISC